MDIDDVIEDLLKFCPVCGQPLVEETTGTKNCDEHGTFSVKHGVVYFAMLIDGKIPRMH